MNQMTINIYHINKYDNFTIDDFISKCCSTGYYNECDIISDLSKVLRRIRINVDNEYFIIKYYNISTRRPEISEIDKDAIKELLLNYTTSEHVTTTLYDVYLKYKGYITYTGSQGENLIRNYKSSCVELKYDILEADSNDEVSDESIIRDFISATRYLFGDTYIDVLTWLSNVIQGRVNKNNLILLYKTNEYGYLLIQQWLNIITTILHGYVSIPSNKTLTKNIRTLLTIDYEISNEIIKDTLNNHIIVCPTNITDYDVNELVKGSIYCTRLGDVEKEHLNKFNLSSLTSDEVFLKHLTHYFITYDSLHDVWC